MLEHRRLAAHERDAARAARRRIERDLHDGAQQRLIALQIQLALVRERIEPDAPAGAAALRALEREAERTAEELRALAHGTAPPLLAEHGIGPALRAASRGAPLPTIVRGDVEGRHPPAVERTVYFACMEALQNAAKHARGATGVTIAIDHEPAEALRFEVRDDGPGFAPGVRYGAGLRGLRERLAAVGGRLDIDAPPGGGTRVTGVIPSA